MSGKTPMDFLLQKVPAQKRHRYLWDRLLVLFWLAQPKSSNGNQGWRAKKRGHGYYTCQQSKKMFGYRNARELVGLNNNNINNNSQQSKLLIQANEVKWTETTFLPGLLTLPPILTINFDNLHPGNENFVSNKKAIINWIVTTQNRKLLWCNFDLRTIN